MNQNTKDKIAMWIAWHLPRWLVYWCAVRMAAHATQGPWGNETPSSVGIMEMLKRWDTSSESGQQAGE